LRAYITRTLLLYIPVLFGVTLLVFILLKVVPGDPLSGILSNSQVNAMTNEEIKALQHQYGLDKPIVIQYFDWLGQILKGDFGTSIAYTGQSVWSLLSVGLRVTIPIDLIATALGCTVGILLGIFAALKPNTILDRMVTTVAIGAISIPGYWLGIVFIYIFAVNLHWLPAAGWVNFSESPIGWLRCVTLPIVTLSLGGAGTFMRYTRSAMLEVLSQDYIRTAWSKGLNPRVVIIRHALRNALIPLLTIFGMSLAYMLAGSVLIENIFALPGMGQLTNHAIFSRDFPVLQGILLFVSSVILLMNLLTDVGYAAVDPRVRYK